MLHRFVITALLLCCGHSAVAACNRGPIRAQAVQDIEYLRRAYARATDTIGKATASDVEAGRRVYHRIFTADAKIGASGIDGLRTGPDAWVEVVLDALGPLGPTQHFIGTQMVQIESLELGPDCRVVAGSATMDSHLQAWHTRADGKVWIVVGNYVDRVSFVPGAGWQITDMYLQRTTEEVRPSATKDPVREQLSVELDDMTAGWVNTGLSLEAGDAVALFARGAFEAEGMRFAPRHMLWYRVGPDGNAEELISDQDVFTAASDGDLFLTLRPLGVLWADRRGSYPDGFSEAPAVPADVQVDVLRLTGTPQRALQRLAVAGDTDARAALAALAARKTLPDGFEQLWFLSRANVWQAGTADGGPGISAQTDDDASIVRMPLDLPLTEATRLEFSWRYDALPALGPETEAQFHDYLSVALEFDNGEDLTWFWSRELEPGTHFACPLPGWEARETHWVLQSGSEGLGDWFDHDRPVLADYRASIAGPEPGRITGVWFIANSVFGRQPGAASFAEVTVVEGQDRFPVFGPGAP